MFDSVLPLTFYMCVIVLDSGLPLTCVIVLDGGYYFGQRLAAYIIHVCYCVAQRSAAFSSDNGFLFKFESGLPLLCFVF